MIVSLSHKGLDRCPVCAGCSEKVEPDSQRRDYLILLETTPPLSAATETATHSGLLTACALAGTYTPADEQISCTHVNTNTHKHHMRKHTLLSTQTQVMRTHNSAGRWWQTHLKSPCDKTHHGEIGSRSDDLWSPYPQKYAGISAHMPHTNTHLYKAGALIN